jgi:hypothetical protein
MGLHGGDHQVVHAGLGDPVSGLHGLYMVLGAVLHDKLESFLADGLEVSAAADERHVLARQGELHAEHSADGAGADDAYSHRGHLL